MRWNLPGLLRDTRGASMIEAAFILPIMGLVCCGGTDTVLGFSQKLRDQQAADRAVQFAINAGLATATQTMIQSEVTASSGVPAANAAVRFWLECGGVVQSNFNGTCSSGSPARYLSVTVTDFYTPLFIGPLSVSTIPLQGFAEGRLQ